MKRDYEIRILRPVGEVFAVLAAVEKYHEWLPTSETYVRTAVVDEPIKEGSEYIDYQSHGIEMPGVVHIYEPPQRIGFRQGMKMPLGSQLAVRIEYTLMPDGAGTHVVRRHIFKMPLLLRVAELVLRSKIIRENERIVAALKCAVESPLEDDA